jgi:hypothetical protein
VVAAGIGGGRGTGAGGWGGAVMRLAVTWLAVVLHAGVHRHSTPRTRSAAHSLYQPHPPEDVGMIDSKGHGRGFVRRRRPELPHPCDGAVRRGVFGEEEVGAHSWLRDRRGLTGEGTGRLAGREDVGWRERGRCRAVVVLGPELCCGKGRVSSGGHRAGNQQHSGRMQSHAGTGQYQLQPLQPPHVVVLRKYIVAIAGVGQAEVGGCTVTRTLVRLTK